MFHVFHGFQNDAVSHPQQNCSEFGGLTSNCSSLVISRSGDVIRRKKDRRVAGCALHG